MASYLVCWHEREDRACVTHGCKCCSATCCVGHWALWLSVFWAVFCSVFTVWWIFKMVELNAVQPFTGIEIFAFTLLTFRSVFVAAVHAALVAILCILRGPARRHVNATWRVGTGLHRKLVVIFSVLLAVNGAWLVLNGVIFVVQRASSTRPQVLPSFIRIALEIFVFLMNAMLIAALFIHLDSASKAAAKNERAESAVQNGADRDVEGGGGGGGAEPYLPPIVDAVMVSEKTRNGTEEDVDGGPGRVQALQGATVHEVMASSLLAVPPRVAADA